MLLENKTAIITGAASGIGRKTAEVIIKQGAKVIALDYLSETDLPDGVEYYKLDVSSTADCEAIFHKITESHKRIDVLVNCAGITRDALTKKMSEQQFDDVIAVNLKGVWNLTRLVGPYMQNQHGGSIINVSSVVAIYGNIGQANYAATKAGVIGMTKSWAKEFAYKGGNVRVNAVAPGYTMTNMLKTVPQDLLDKFAGQTMLGRLAQPEEIANAILFLASDLSSYITGETLNVNGGMRL